MAEPERKITIRSVYSVTVSSPARIMKRFVNQYPDVLSIYAGMFVLLGVIGIEAAVHTQFLLFLRIPLAVAFVLFVPGYLLTTLFFPRKGGIGGYERVALSIALSVAVVPAQALLLSYLNFARDLTNILIVNSLTVIVFSLPAVWRRNRVSPEDRILRPADTSIGVLSRMRSAVKVQDLVLLIVFVALLIASGFIISEPSPTDLYTEFYIVNQDGFAQGFANNLTVGAAAQMNVGVSNHEGQSVSYRIRAVQNNEVIGSSEDFSLEDQKSVEFALEFTPTRAGDDELIEFQLYRDPHSDEIYRSDWLRFKILGPTDVSGISP